MPPTRPKHDEDGALIQILSWVAELHPHLSAKAARCIALGSLIDSLYGEILISMLGARAKPATTMLLTLQQGSFSQVRAVRAVAASVLDTHELELLDAVTAICDRAKSHRHRFAHWIWASSEDYPNSIVLVDPKALIEYEQEATGFLSVNDNRALQKNFDRRKCLVYDEVAIDEAAAELTEAEQCLALLRYLFYPFTRELIEMGQQPTLTLDENPKVKAELAKIRSKRGKRG